MNPDGGVQAPLFRALFSLLVLAQHNQSNRTSVYLISCDWRRLFLVCVYRICSNLKWRDSHLMFRMVSHFDVKHNGGHRLKFGS